MANWVICTRKIDGKPFYVNLDFARAAKRLAAAGVDRQVRGEAGASDRAAAVRPHASADRGGFPPAGRMDGTDFNAISERGRWMLKSAETAPRGPSARY